MTPKDLSLRLVFWSKGKEDLIIAKRMRVRGRTVAESCPEKIYSIFPTFKDEIMSSGQVLNGPRPPSRGQGREDTTGRSKTMEHEKSTSPPL